MVLADDPGRSVEEQSAQQAAGVPGLPDYPRMERFEQGSVTVDFPAIEAWADFRFLRAWLPVEIILAGDEQAWVGAVQLEAATEINFDERVVTISNPTVLEFRFPDMDYPETVSELASMAFKDRRRVVPLDVQGDSATRQLRGA